MSRIGAVGELVLAAFFAVFGVLWIYGAFGFPFWEGFAPQSGFMPLLYGILLTGLSVAVALNAARERNAGAEREPIGKPVALILILAVTVVGVDVVGFALAVFLSMTIIYAAVERLPLHRSILVAAATSAGLTLVFRAWLSVPLPVGPLGI
jgi:hypothetical protein